MWIARDETAMEGGQAQLVKKSLLFFIIIKQERRLSQTSQ